VPRHIYIYIYFKKNQKIKKKEKKKNKKKKERRGVGVAEPSIGGGRPPRLAWGWFGHPQGTLNFYFLYLALGGGQTTPRPSGNSLWGTQAPFFLCFFLWFLFLFFIF
jgi:hypothetical protein